MIPSTDADEASILPLRFAGLATGFRVKLSGFMGV